MRRVYLTAGLVLAFNIFALAQLNTMKDPAEQMPTSPGLATDKPQISGCLAKNASGQGFMLTNVKYRDGVPVASDKDLASQVGHTVILTGVWKKMAASGDAKGEKVKTFNASRVDKISDDCKVGMK